MMSLCVQVRGADISAVEGGILQHLGNSGGSGEGGSGGHVTIPGQVCHQGCVCVCVHGQV